MKIKEKIWGNIDQLVKDGPITIVALGDSITHGAFELGQLDYDAVYWNVLRRRILEVRNYIPVNVINAGIGGVTAQGSLDRIESQVMAHHPDLVTVCFGLNDVNGSLDDYLSSLRRIFEKCSGTEVIFMTPNMLNTYVADDVLPELADYAAVTAEYQNGGRMDQFMEEAVKLAREMNVAVCDCYSEWKEWSKTQDTTKLLANRINHPTREMHKVFADRLFQVIFADTEARECQAESTMYRG